MVRYSCFKQPLNRKGNPRHPACMCRTVSHSALPSPTKSRKFAVAEWGSRKINPNKICAECWTGAAFGPYWLLTERLRYETTPLLPALRDRLHVHGQLDDAHGSHCGSDTASGGRRAAGAGRRCKQRHGQGQRRHRHKRDGRFCREQRRDFHRYRRSKREQRSQHGKRGRHQWHHHRGRHQRHHHRGRHQRHHHGNHRPHPIPPHASRRHPRGHHNRSSNCLRPLRHGNPKRRHLHRLVGRRPRGLRDDLPRDPDRRLVPGQGAHGRAHLLGRRQPGERLRPVAPGMVQLPRPGHRGPRLHLRLHGVGHVPHPLLLYGQRQKRFPKRQGDLLPAHHGGGDRKRRRPPKRHADRQQRRGPVQARDKRLGIRHGAMAPRLDARPAGVRPKPQLVLGRKRPHAPPGHLRELPAYLLQAP